MSAPAPVAWNRASLAHGALLGLGVEPTRRFESALHQVEAVQATLLAGILARGRDTAFGQAHGFGELADLAAFREAVPARTYDEHHPWIARVARGEAGVLTAAPVHLLEPTSGSTRAAKWIPYTAELQGEFQRAVVPWFCDMTRRFPDLLGGPAYWSVTPATRPETPEGCAIPVGFASDAAYLGGTAGSLVEAMLAVPSAAAALGEVDRFREVSLLHLLHQEELRMLSVWHPSFLALLLEHLRADFTALVDRIEAGLDAGDPALDLPPAPGRAARLRGVDPADLRALWPRLALVSAWADGAAAPAARALAAEVAPVPFEGKGLLATEGVVSIPWGGGDPVLAVASHVFEFLPEDGGRARGAHELEEGGRYEVLLTTSGGLYRYRLGDRVEVTGHAAGAPRLRFLGRADRVVDLRGEKLSEGFVAGVLADLLGPDQERFAMLAPETEPEPPRYQLFLGPPHPDGSGLPGRLDAALRQNPHYAWCRDLGQLGPPEVLPVGPRAGARFLEREAALGTRMGGVKPTPLSPRSGWAAALADAVPDV